MFCLSIEKLIKFTLLYICTFSVQQIIQTFFVSTLTKTLWETLQDIWQNPNDFVNVLAESLPSKSTYFLQILVVRSTVVGLSTELLRVVPLIQAFFRKCFGPNLTDKERNSVFWLFRPLADPYYTRFGVVFGADVLYFMVLFVYTTLAPLVNFFLALCFLLMGSAYRYQFIANYPKDPDSGGVLFYGFVQLVQSCMVIAQVTILGFLALKKAVAAMPLMMPLVVITLLFNLYTRQQHYRVGFHVASEECFEMDDMERLEEEELDLASLFKNAYLQPALKVKMVNPDIPPEVLMEINGDCSGNNKSTVDQEVPSMLACPSNSTARARDKKRSLERQFSFTAVNQDDERLNGTSTGSASQISDDESSEGNRQVADQQPSQESATDHILVASNGTERDTTLGSESSHSPHSEGIKRSDKEHRSHGDGIGGGGIATKHYISGSFRAISNTTERAADVAEDAQDGSLLTSDVEQSEMRPFIGRNSETDFDDDESPNHSGVFG